jgi:hypothetical protein
MTATVVYAHILVPNTPGVFDAFRGAKKESPDPPLGMEWGFPGWAQGMVYQSSPGIMGAGARAASKAAASCCPSLIALEYAVKIYSQA